MDGATSSSLSFPAVAPTNAGAYHVRVQNNESTAFSSPAKLNVYSGQLTAGFTTQGLELSASALPGASYAIEWSSDLSHWNDLVTVLNAGATWKFTDTDTAASGNKFYRLRKL